MAHTSHWKFLGGLYLDGDDNMSGVFEKVVGIDGHNTGLVWLGHISKDGVHHACTNQWQLHMHIHFGFTSCLKTQVIHELRNFCTSKVAINLALSAV